MIGAELVSMVAGGAGEFRWRIESAVPGLHVMSRAGVWLGTVDPDGAIRSGGKVVARPSSVEAAGVWFLERMGKR